MSMQLATWLKDRREAFAVCWQSEPADRPGHTHDQSRTGLATIFQGLVAAADGDFTPLEGLIQQQSSGHSAAPPPLHGLVQGTLKLRQQAWRLLSQNGHTSAEALALLEELEQLLDNAVVTLARRWEVVADASLQERISQAEFIAESLAQATEESDRAALQLSMLNEMTQRLSAILDRDQVAVLVGDILYGLLKVEHLAIWLAEPERLVLVRWYGEPEPCLLQLPLPHGKSEDLLLRAFQYGVTLFDSQPVQEQQGSWYTANCGVLAVPIVTAGQAIGVVIAQDPNAPVLLSRSQQSLTTSIASQAAIALQNARLYDEIRRFNADLELRIAERTSELQAERDRLETLYQIAIEVGSMLNLDKLLTYSLNALAELVGVCHGSIMLLDLETEHLVDRAVLGREAVGYIRFPVGSGLVGWVAQHKKPVIVHDISRDERWVKYPLIADDKPHKQHGSIIAVPLLAQDQLLGVLMLSHSEIGYFNDDHLRLLNAIGSEIGIAVHNALLYDQIYTEVTRRGELLRYQELEASKNAAILQSLSDGVVVCDTDGSVLLVNTAAERMLERSVSDLLTWNLRDMLQKLIASRPQLATVSLPDLDDLLHDPVDAQEQLRSARTDFQLGAKMISLTLGPVLTTKGELLGAVAVFRDITREVESDRLKTEFIGTVSHELRTPMTSIKGYTQLLAMGSLGEINDTQREFLNTIQTNAERMITIINDLLDITKIETGSVELEVHAYHLAEILSSVIGDYRLIIANRDQELSISLPPGLPLVVVDSRRLHQIIGNLFNNAIKYTPRAGRVSIEAREVTPSQLPAQIAETLPAGKRWVLVEVSDTGVGIDAAEQEKIFDRFYRADNPLKIEAGGTGLGLSLVRSLVALLGGQIWVSSKLNEGSTFSLLLPAL